MTKVNKSLQIAQLQALSCVDEMRSVHMDKDQLQKVSKDKVDAFHKLINTMCKDKDVRNHARALRGRLSLQTRREKDCLMYRFIGHSEKEETQSYWFYYKNPKVFKKYQEIFLDIKDYGRRIGSCEKETLDRKFQVFGSKKEVKSQTTEIEKKKIEEQEEKAKKESLHKLGIESMWWVASDTTSIFRKSVELYQQRSGDCVFTPFMGALTYGNIVLDLIVNTFQAKDAISDHKIAKKIKDKEGMRDQNIQYAKALGSLAGISLWASAEGVETFGSGAACASAGMALGPSCAGVFGAVSVVSMGFASYEIGRCRNWRKRLESYTKNNDVQGQIGALKFIKEELTVTKEEAFAIEKKVLSKAKYQNKTKEEMQKIIIEKVQRKLAQKHARFERRVGLQAAITLKQATVLLEKMKVANKIEGEPERKEAVEVVKKEINEFLSKMSSYINKMIKLYSIILIVSFVAFVALVLGVFVGGWIPLAMAVCVAGVALGLAIYKAVEIYRAKKRHSEQNITPPEIAFAEGFHV